MSNAYSEMTKLITDQLASGEGIQIISVSRGTGKTPKFIVENSTNGADLKIVLRDDFSEGRTDPGAGFANACSRSNVKILLGSIDNVYLQDLSLIHL